MPVSLTAFRCEITSVSYMPLAESVFRFHFIPVACRFKRIRYREFWPKSTPQNLGVLPPPGLSDTYYSAPRNPPCEHITSINIFGETYYCRHPPEAHMAGNQASRTVVALSSTIASSRTTSLGGVHLLFTFFMYALRALLLLFRRGNE